jgi:UDP-2-acetamido-3-amino-2,3-dideoxy-glucuronate N-acetyltransferase
VVIKNHVSIWNGITIASNVFIGAGVVFTNDKYPMAGDRTKPLLPTIVESGATIGAGAVILPGFTIGSNSMVAAGAVVTRNIEAGEVFISKLR